jgi:hypothetical protein
VEFSYIILQYDKEWFLFVLFGEGAITRNKSQKVCIIYTTHNDEVPPYFCTGNTPSPNKKEIYSLNIHVCDGRMRRMGGGLCFLLFITIISTFFATLSMYVELLSRQSTPSEAH